MTLLEIKTQAASNLEVTNDDFIVNGQDMFLFAVNQARRNAEMTNAFEFSRKTVTLSLDGVTGGSLDDAVLLSDGTTGVIVRSVIEVGLYDTDGNLRPIEWTTVSEGLERQREENPRFAIRYPTDADNVAYGQARVVFSGSNVFYFPKSTDATFNLGLEVYSMNEDWTEDDISTNPDTDVDYLTVTGTLSPGLTGTYTRRGVVNGCSFYVNTANTAWIRFTTGWILATFTSGDDGTCFVESGTSDPRDPSGSYASDNGATGTATVVVTFVDSDPWLTFGAQYLLWMSVIHLNKRFKFFVPRTEGNLPPPEDLAIQGLESLKDWDINRFEAFRRHGR